MSDFDTFDLYQVLGVERDASEAEIRDAFNRAAMTEHPDRSGHPDAEQRIRRVYEARDTLLNAELRAAYDPDADQRSRRAAQEQERQAPRRPPPRRPDPQTRPPRRWTPRPPRRRSPDPPRREPTDCEEDRESVQQELRELAGSTILTQRRWFRADSDRQHYHPAAYAEFLRQEQRYLMALRFAPGLFFALLAIGSFAAGDTLGGIISAVVAVVALVACAYLAALDWFVWLYLFAAVPTVELAKIMYAALRVAFHFASRQVRQRWEARRRSTGSDE